MSLVRICAVAASVVAGDGVERGADGAPVAFRIWKAGPNVTDHGVHTFSEESARKLLAEQAARGNLYSIDVDHLSLSKEAPPEARKAVGWHRLDVRAGELWAVDVEWTEDVRAGLAKSPPEWRYFSPAYDVAKKTGEIISYLNTALTNNPATWSVTALASSTAKPETCTMATYQEIAAALMGDDDEKKKEARSAIAAMNDQEAKAFKAWKKATFDGDPDEKKEEPKADAKAAEEPPGDKKEEPKEEKKAAVAATKATEAELLKTVGDQDKRLAELEAKDRKAQIETILAARPDLTEKQVKHLRGKTDPAEVQQLVDLIDAPVVDPAAAAKVTATRGSHDAGTETVRAARLPQDEHKDLVERMGGQVEVPAVRWRGNAKEYPMISREDARKILASRKAAPAAARPAVSRNIEHARRIEATQGGR